MQLRITLFFLELPYLPVSVHVFPAEFLKSFPVSNIQEPGNASDPTKPLENPWSHNYPSSVPKEGSCVDFLHRGKLDFNKKVSNSS